MLSIVNDRLRDEACRYQLRFECEDCAHFEPVQQSCASGYPNQDHRRLPLAGRATLVFCKEFELA